MKRLSADNRIMSRSTPISPDFSAYLVAFQQTLVRGSAHNILVCSLVVLYTTFQALSWLNLLKALAHILCGLHAKMQTVLASPSHKKGFGSIMAFIICRCELKVYEGEKEKGVLTNGVTHCFSKACHILSELLFGGLGCMMKELCASFFCITTSVTFAEFIMIFFFCTAHTQPVSYHLPLVVLLMRVILPTFYESIGLCCLDMTFVYN